MNTITLDTIIISPKLIAAGRGAYTGPLSDFIYDPSANVESVEEALVADGRLTETQVNADDFHVADYAHLLTLEDVRAIADDPNATIQEG